MESSIDWNKIKASKRKALSMYPDLYKIPLIKSHKLILKYVVKDGDEVLDFGANNRSLKEYISKTIQKNVSYYSFDIDRSFEHDFYSLEDIDKVFDVVIMFEVLEHLSISEIFTTINQASSLLKPGGSIVVSIPNIFHPTRFWRDCTHTTPLNYYELLGLLELNGFEGFRIFRLKRFKPLDYLSFALYYPLLKFLDIDYATGIIVSGIKK
jgi:SAM-dependent methyltransferase